MLTANIMLPMGALLTCLFVGWYIPRQVVADEFTNQGTLSARLLPVYRFAVRYVCPTAIVLIFLHQLGVI
jgi:NSS family neurotransmitter:Na+ symporter